MPSVAPEATVDNAEKSSTSRMLPVGHKTGESRTGKGRTSSNGFRANIQVARQYSRWERLQMAIAANWRRIRSRPSIALISFLSACVTTAVLLALVFVLRANQQAVLYDEAETQSFQIASYAEQIVLQSVAPAQALSIIIYETPDVDDLYERFPVLAKQILAQLTVSNAALFATLEIAPDTVILEVYPYDGEAEDAIGLDLYNHPLEFARSTVRRTIESRKFTFQGPLPVNGTDGRPIVLVRYPVFVPVTEATILSDDGTMGSATGAHFWPIDPATDTEPAKVFWGFSIVVLNFEEFLEAIEVGIGNMDVDRYGYRIFRPKQDSREEETFLVTDPPPRYGITVAEIELPNETWAVELGLKSRFSPAWTYAGFAASVVVGLIVGLLVLAALLASARHLDLLEALLPKHVIHSLHKGTVVAEFLPEVATLFADIVGYTKLSSTMEPRDVLAMLNRVFALFDDLCDSHGAYKLEIIGDAYLSVAGVEPGDTLTESVRRVSELALDMVEAMRHFPEHNGHPVKIRVGLHVGPLVAGVVGSKKPKYTLVGETMNVGSRMESTGEPMKVQVSKRFKEALEAAGCEGLELRPRMGPDGPGVYVKGKGQMETYWLTRAGWESENGTA